MPKIFGIDIRVRNPITTAIDKAIESGINARLSSMAETDTTIVVGTRTGKDLFPDRANYDRETILREVLLAWRTNPIARRITDAIVEFVVGDGMSPEYEKIKNKTLQTFVKEWWEHDLNDLDEQIPEWVAEQSRTGDLFILGTTLASTGDTFYRAVPSEHITEIQTFANDYRQETHYMTGELMHPGYPAYNPNDLEQTTFMLHFPINRLVGNTFGEADLTPVLRWLGRLSTLLNDRVIMNHLRNLITYIVTGTFKSKNERERRELELNLKPPTPGSVLVTDQSEIWGVLSPNLQSFDAQQDILAIKKYIAAGIGLPLHYLAEPESSTRTTAEAAGTPTFRKFKMRQNSTKRAIAKMIAIAIIKKRHFSSKRMPFEKIGVRSDDVTERDNSTLALAASRIEPALADLFDRELIDEPTYLLLFYEMLGHDYDTEQPQPKGKRAPLSKSDQSNQIVKDADPGDPIDDTGAGDTNA